MGRDLVKHFGIKPEVASELFGDLLMDHLGGHEAVELAVRYHEDRVPMRQLASEHQISIGGTCTTINRVRVKLRRLGLLPQTWERGKSEVERDKHEAKHGSGSSPVGGE
jgi:hypothetical protein